MLEGIVCGLVMGCGDQAAGIQLGVSCRDNRGNREVGEIREVELVQPWVLHSSPNPPTTTPREHGERSAATSPYAIYLVLVCLMGQVALQSKPVGGSVLPLMKPCVWGKQLNKNDGRARWPQHDGITPSTARPTRVCRTYRGPQIHLLVSS